MLPPPSACIFAGYRPGTRLPTFLWAYPLEFNDASVASQNPNSVQTFTSIGGPSELFMALAGYAVLDNATIPIVGDPQTINDTYVSQLVAGAKAAIDKAVEIGVTDPDRVAVGGHSYGAFMTANVLAHSQLFRAGIARSGAYNRTLTPFGFQNERRSYWEATDLYTKMSPFTYANAIKDPLLLVHGMVDDNTGTFPIQSERMFAAIEGTAAQRASWCCRTKLTATLGASGGDGARRNGRLARPLREERKPSHRDRPI